MKLRTAFAVTVVLVVASVTARASCIRQTGRIAGGPAAGVVALGDLAVIGSGPRLVVVDISDPVSPTAVADVSLSEIAPSPGSSCVTPLAGHGRLVAVSESCSYSARLLLVDLTEADDPRVVSSIDLFDAADHAVFIGDILWVSSPIPIGDVVHSSVTAYDLQDPMNPESLGRYVTGRWLFDMDADGNVLAVLEAWDPRMTLLDVSDPASDPAVLSSTPVSDDVRTLTIADDRVFMATQNAIEVLDISDPTQPVESMSVPWLRLGAPTDLIAVGDRLYLGLVDLDPQIAEPDGGLEIFGLDDPSSPSARDSIVFSSGAALLAASGRSLLVADADRGLRVFDVDAMASPIRPGIVNPTADEVVAIDVDDGVAYLADHGLRVVDLDAGPDPVVIGSYELDTPMVYDPSAAQVVERDRTVRDVAAETGGLAVISTSDGVLEVVDVSVPQRPVALGQLEIVGSTDPFWRIALSGNLAAAVGDTSDGLVLIDLADPSNPVEAGRGLPSGRPLDVALQDDLAIVAIGPWSSEPDRGGVDIFDISDRSAPTVIGSLAFGRATTAVAVEGRVAVAVDRGALHVVDLADPTAPLVVGTVSAALGAVFGVALDGGTAWVSAVPGGATLIQISDPTGPSVVATSSWQAWTNPDGGPVGGVDVAVWNGRAVVADGTFGVRILARGLCRSPDPGPARTAGAE